MAQHGDFVYQEHFYNKRLESHLYMVIANEFAEMLPVASQRKHLGWVGRGSLTGRAETEFSRTLQSFSANFRKHKSSTIIFLGKYGLHIFNAVISPPVTFRLVSLPSTKFPLQNCVFQRPML